MTYIWHKNTISRILMLLSGIIFITGTNYTIFYGINYLIIFMIIISGFVFARSIYKFTWIIYHFNDDWITIKYKNIWRQAKNLHIPSENITNISRADIFFGQIWTYKKWSDEFLVSSDKNVLFIETESGNHIYISPRIIPNKIGKFEIPQKF